MDSLKKFLSWFFFAFVPFAVVLYLLFQAFMIAAFLGPNWFQNGTWGNLNNNISLVAGHSNESFLIKTDFGNIIWNGLLHFWVIPLVIFFPGFWVGSFQRIF